MGVQLDGLGGMTVAVEDGGQDALASQDGNLLADDRARRGSELRTGAHDGTSRDGTWAGLLGWSGAARRARHPRREPKS